MEVCLVLNLGRQRYAILDPFQEGEESISGQELVTRAREVGAVVTEQDLDRFVYLGWETPEEMKEMHLYFVDEVMLAQDSAWEMEFNGRTRVCNALPLQLAKDRSYRLVRKQAS